MKVRTAAQFDETIEAHPNLKSRLADFLKTKESNPIQPFGKDTRFISDGPIGRTGLKLSHAALSQDVSVVYRIHGKDPHTIDLFGLFRHKELGTTNSANIKLQQNLAKRFKNDPISKD